MSGGGRICSSANNEFNDIKAFLEDIRSQQGSEDRYVAETKGNHTVNIPANALAQVVDKFFGAMLVVAEETGATYDAYVNGFNYWLKLSEKRINDTHGESLGNASTGFIKSALKQQVAYEMR